jgi:hypothetical protein
MESGNGTGCGGNGVDLSWSQFALIAVCFLCLALTSNLLFPVFEGPDEASHFQYARLLAQGKGLPVQTDPLRSADTEGFGPPLYYLVPAAILRAIDPDRGSGIRRIGVLDLGGLARQVPDNRLPPRMNPDWFEFGSGTAPNLFFHPPGGPLVPGPERFVHVMRLFSTGCALATLAALMLLAREVAPGNRVLQLTALSLVAFNPQFIYLSGILNNDNLVTALATTTMLFTVRLLRSEEPTARQVLALGLLLGTGMLAKPNMLFMAVPVTFVIWYRSPGVGTFLRRWGACVAGAALLSFWYYGRNALLYGNLDFSGWKTRAALHPFFVLRPEQRWDFLTTDFVPLLFTSYWGRFGWLTFTLPRWHYLVYGALSAPALVALFPRGRDRLGHLPATTLLLGGAVALNLAALLAFNMVFLAEQGRLLYPSLAAFALLAAIGLDRLLPLIIRQLLPVILLALALFSQWFVVFPVYFG